MKKTRLTGQPNTMKQVNQGLIRNALILAGTATRVELSEATKVSQPTVNAIIKKMVENGEVVEMGYAFSSGGRKAMRYGFNHERSSVAAVILNKESMIYEIGDLSGKSLEKEVVPIQEGKTYLDNLSGLVEKILDKSFHVKGLAVGVPAAVAKNGQLFAIPQIPELEGVNLKEELQKQFEVSINVLNDINTVAYGYYRKGIDARIEDMVYIHAGQGLGASLIVNQKVVNGFSSFAGEIGYMRVNGEENVEQLLAKENKESKGDIMSRIVANIISMINPPLMVFGGSNFCDGLLGEIKKYCIANLPSGMVPNLMIVEDEEKYYLEGAIQVAIDSVREEIRLVLN
ncbi:putative NBD/HSP70 family sugar kinase [Aequitasia blattaphilus]|uniref:ROK family transcriptional regulator n=1 Tax=Aequitasia blattaphilus TaxID=2949332 RepID=A0ABT1EA56_9FIRM|nr:ROK family transcriptional regulator [Aequitasia blattaphilus]MCP1102704.1 ROK family transcriptional regulator [Aequitasia blattaphilus]MCR8615344.1 ROK family transcriptional regulator [Aequitasia blattaphilus]